MTEILQGTLLVLLAANGTAVVMIEEPVRQAMAASLYGLILALVFLVLQAPGVALSELVVGSIVIPLLILFTVIRIRERDR